MTVKTDALTAFPLMDVLCDINDARNTMMRTSRQQIDDSLVYASIVHVIVNHH